MTAQGAAWEAQLERLHDRYARDQLAKVVHNHPCVRVHVDRGSTFVGSWRADGPVDFGGTIAPFGRSVQFDAKDCKSADRRFPLAQIERHQARDLEAHHLIGAATAIALRLNGEAFWLPWSELGPLFWRWHETPGRAARGTASVTRASWWRPFDVAGDGWLPCLGA